MKISVLVPRVVTHSCAYSEAPIHEGVFQMFSVRQQRREKKTCCNRLLSTTVDDMQSVQHNHARRKGEYTNEGNVVVARLPLRTGIDVTEDGSHNEQLAHVNKGKQIKMVMGFFTCFLLAAATTLCITRQAFGLECAVCLPSDENASIAKEIQRLFFNDQSTLVACNQTIGLDEDAIIKTCPSDSLSCHIQKTKDWTAKTCSRISVDDCKTANRVKYCYCKTNRCNTQNHTLSTTTIEPAIQTTESTTIAALITRPADEVYHTTSRLRPKDQAKSESKKRQSDCWSVLSSLLALYSSIHFYKSG